jgi:Ca2+-binding EF-hand superfamily protein
MTPLNLSAYRLTRLVLISGLLGVLSLPAHGVWAQDAPPWRDGDPGELRDRSDGQGRQRGPRLPNIFISPAGKPYRARPGDPYPVAVWFAEADTNHDGKLTVEEMRADAAAFFRQLDANHDGVIDGAEVQAYEQEVAPEILPKIDRLHEGEGINQNLDIDDTNNTERPGRNGQGGGRRGGGGQSRRAPAPKGEGVQGAAVYSLINQPEPVAAADMAFDGRITLAEFLAAADRHFEILDEKQQGYLALRDLPKTPLQDMIERLAKQKKAREAQNGRDAPPRSEGP